MKVQSEPKVKLNNQDILLLRKYLNDECSKKELISVASLLTDPNKHESLPIVFENASVKFHSYAETGKTHKDIAWSKISNDLSRPNEIEMVWYNQRWLKVAASITLIIGLGSYFSFYADNALVNQSELVTQMKTIENNLGEKSRLTLPDGSTIIMNSGTSITYPVVFSDSTRLVSMKGEAFFDVREDINRPFEVEVGGIKARVLGTTFNIRSYDYFKSTSISLLTGKIALDLPYDNNELVLVPGQELVFNTISRSYALDAFDAEIVTGWQTGVLQFHDASEFEVINILEHWYNVKIQTQNSTSNRWENLTAKFKNQSLENVLVSLGYTLGFDYEINGQNIIIKYK